MICKRKKTFGFLFLLLGTIASCSESSEQEDDYANWKSRNEDFFCEVYQKADSTIHADGNNEKWKIFRKWSLQEQFGSKKDNNIVAHVLEKSASLASPIYTDSVVVDIQGRLIPTAFDKDGYIFYSTFSGGERNLKSDLLITMSANGKLKSDDGKLNKVELDGLSTALQQMHAGDRWMVYVPYNLGYQGQNLTQPFVPAYSTLVFDVTLVCIKR